MSWKKMQQRFVAGATASAIGLLNLLALAVAPAQAAVPMMPQVNPTIDSGKAPYGSARTPGVNFLDLDKAAYVEEEYYLSGNADARDEKGNILATAAPYRTRFLVRKPKDPKKFSGNVIVTPFNWDRESAREWGFTKYSLVKHGDVFIGLSLVKEQIEGFPLKDHGLKFLKSYDPLRYGPLTVYFDPNTKRYEMAQSHDVLAQLAFLLKSNGANSPLKGMKVERVIGYSLGVGGPVFESYITQGRQLSYRTTSGKPLYDGYMVGANTLLPVPPADKRTNAVFVLVQNEREFNRDNVAKLEMPADTDVPKFRMYDFVGSPHLGRVVTNEATGESELGNDTPEAPKTGAPRGVTAAICNSHNDAPVGFVQSALLRGIVRWVQNGVPMPRAPRVELAGVGLGEKLDPDSGNAAGGGLRPPWITVPVATYYTGASQGCGVWEPMKRYDAAKLKSLYGNYETYVQKFEAAKLDFVKAGYLLPEDVAEMKPIARPEDFVAK